MFNDIDIKNEKHFPLDMLIFLVNLKKDLTEKKLGKYC